MYYSTVYNWIHRFKTDTKEASFALLYTRKKKIALQYATQTSEHQGNLTGTTVIRPNEPTATTRPVELTTGYFTVSCYLPPPLVHSVRPWPLVLISLYLHITVPYAFSCSQKPIHYFNAPCKLQRTMLQFIANKKFCNIPQNPTLRYWLI
jgi:hypothetical protein